MGNLTPQKLEQDFNNSAEEKISQLLFAMPRVEAPGDFGFGVKARIAEGKPSALRPMWLPAALKAGVPIGLVLAIGGYAGFTSLYVNDTSAPPRAAVETIRPGLVQAVPAAPVPAPISSPEALAKDVGPIEATPFREVAVKRAAVKRPAVVRSTAENKDGSGSYEESQSDVRKLLTSKDPVTPVSETPVRGTPAGEILTKIGVNALFGEGGWKADSVSPNTAAAKAGVKAGDIIESVDGQDMTDLGSVAKPATGKKLKVKRDGKTVEIVID
jgi:membrane-associated protease RseP (regulator of RpoE activity)